VGLVDFDVSNKIQFVMIWRAVKKYKDKSQKENSE